MPDICVSFFFCTAVKPIQRVREPEVGFSIYQLEVGLCGPARMFTFCKHSLCPTVGDWELYKEERRREEKRRKRTSFIGFTAV